MSLDRFLSAQTHPHAGLATALAELQAGKKTSHWIWWVFPQLAGLARSSTALKFGLEDLDEARDYLRHPDLAPRLAEAVRTVRQQCSPPASVPLRRLMGSEIDCVKLVSCLTLFSRMGREEIVDAALVADCEAVLAIAAAQGFARCAFTERA